MIGYLIRLQSSPSSVRHSYSGQFTIETMIKSIFYYGQFDLRYLTEFSRVDQTPKSVKYHENNYDGYYLFVFFGLFDLFDFS